MSKPLPLPPWVAGVYGVALLLGSVPAVLAQQLTPASQPRLTEAVPEDEGIVAEPDLIHRAIVIADRRFNYGEVTQGFYTVLGKMVPGAGWISGGPGYRRWYRKDQLFVDTNAAVSWRGYKTAQARVELPRLLDGRLLLGSQARFQDFTQVDYFGEGPRTDFSDRSHYRARSRVFGGYATLRPAEHLAIDAQADWLAPSILAAGGLFEAPVPDTQAVFGADRVFQVADQPTFFHRGLSATLDTRDFPGHPTAGTIYRAAFSDFNDRGLGAFNFKQYEMEAAKFTRLNDRGVVLALHGWLVATDPEAGQVVPFYLQPSLGGQNSLRGYTDYRFHDRNMLVANAELRAPLMTHVDLAGFLDLGNVAAHLGNVDLTKKSLGAGLRLHTRRQTLARLDVARGGDGWMFLLRLNEPLELPRLTRQTATAPFVP